MRCLQCQANETGEGTAMPKDAKKNVDRYKIRGGDLNEFEFHQNQAQVKEPVSGGKKSAKPGKGTTSKKTSAKKKAKK
jgi:hypothetical protein